ncbi:MAG: hypothetical protein ACLSVD_03420 [Eggerthellaceae bacterium]
MLERAVGTPPISTVPRCCRCRRSPLRASCRCRGSTRACPSTSRAACCWLRATWRGRRARAGALRAEQARALAVAYDLDLPDTPEELALLLDEADGACAGGRFHHGRAGLRHEPVIPSAVIEAPLDSDR